MTMVVGEVSEGQRTSNGERGNGGGGGDIRCAKGQSVGVQKRKVCSLK